jgi:hypothetical protein
MSEIQEEMLAALTGMLDPAAFGTAATYKGATVNVIYDRPTEVWSPIEGRMVLTSPQAKGLASDFSAWTANDTIVIGGTTFRIPERPVADEVGFVTMALAK